ncbi:uncharacterized protein PV09_02897 [Verruconis gallopava]|uniref:DUF2470 domain-containing protein n=1 Tax=Verruconis gallopava TaxID=253628 RepID=A0A0D2AHU1_9PEZI|nr:uncharacterized protein PV09_02897 [Verruconis gallopava]KIW06453.1 hypothetical protein PV09_02897 [Verruconis gallopava]
MAAPTEAQVKQRIVGHMNKDHQDSVIRYAEYYGKASRFTSRNAVLQDVALDKLTIVTGGKTIIIPLDPPMQGLKDARERLVEMDKQALAGLNRSPITLKEYKFPKGFPVLVFVACLGTYLLYSRERNMLPGSWLHDMVLKHIPSFTSFALKMRNYIIWPMLVIHITEASIMMNTLKKYSVPLFSRIWWLWTVSCFIEGYDSFRRIRAYEKEKLGKSVQH